MVKRYAGTDKFGWIEDHEGDFVLHYDYAALERDRDKWKARAEKAEKKLDAIRDFLSLR